MTSILLIDDPCGVPLDLWTDPLEDVTRGSMSPDGARPAPPAAASMSVLRARLRCDRERGAPGTGCTLYCARAASNAAASSACEGGRDWNWIRETFFFELLARDESRVPVDSDAAISKSASDRAGLAARSRHFRCVLCATSQILRQESGPKSQESARTPIPFVTCFQRS